jgi:hypothetical protein
MIDLEDKMNKVHDMLQRDSVAKAEKKEKKKKTPAKPKVASVKNAPAKKVETKKSFISFG